MAGIRADVNLNVNTSQAKRSMDRAASEINKVVNGIGGKQVSFGVNSRSFTQPLGRITASANEFTKSLEASNARVIAFGASVGIINGISDAFKGLVLETIKFEKTLMDINVVLDASSDSLGQFGSGLFDVAKNTAQSFTVASEAALEFSRQGLTMEEVLIRTNDALTLTRLTGLKAAEAVSGLTAAVNAFGQAGLSTTDIIDKLAAVDVQFAVSSEDLINALERTGAVAIDAGVEIDSLIGLVTALQQTTARGGAVIGNGLKTIFTRIQRPQSIQQLEDMGIAVKNLSGAILPADKIMLNMAQSFDSLTQSQQSNIVQFSAGIFQANVFRAALKDLSKEQSIQAQATKIAGEASGDAAQKNELLNKTMSAMASQTVSSIQELAETIGKLAFTPEIGGFLSFIQDGVEGIKNMLGGGEEEGDAFAKGLVRGIGNVLTGPAAIAFGAIFIKLFVNISKFARSSLKDVLGIVSEKDKVKQMEESITKALGENLKLQEGLNNLEGDRKAQEQFILGIIEKQNQAMAEQAALSARLARPLIQAGIQPDFTRKASAGMVPESSKKKERQGAAQGGYAAGAIDSMKVKGVGTVVYNKAEKVKQFPGMKQPAIMPPEQSRAGRTYKDAFAGQHGFDPYASGGFVPNFATMNGGKLMLDPSLTQLSANPGSVKGPRNLAKSYAELEATGQPISVEATTKQLLSNSGGSHSKKVKEVIRYLQDEGGVESIERKFKLKKLPKRGKKTDTQAEADVLKAEGGKYFSTGGRSGDPTFPVDLVGLGMNPIEVKSGEWKLPNVLLKSLRLYSDDGLMRFAQSQGATEEMIADARNEKFNKGKKLLTKKGIIGEGYTNQQSHEALLAHRVSQGLVPNYVFEGNRLPDRAMKAQPKKDADKKTFEASGILKITKQSEEDKKEFRSQFPKKKLLPHLIKNLRNKDYKNVINNNFVRSVDKRTDFGNDYYPDIGEEDFQRYEKEYGVIGDASAYVYSKSSRGNVNWSSKINQLGKEEGRSIVRPKLKKYIKEPHYGFDSVSIKKPEVSSTEVGFKQIEERIRDYVSKNISKEKNIDISDIFGANERIFPKTSAKIDDAWRGNYEKILNNNKDYYIKQIESFNKNKKSKSFATGRIFEELLNSGLKAYGQEINYKSKLDNDNWDLYNITKKERELLGLDSAKFGDIKTTYTNKGANKKSFINKFIREPRGRSAAEGLVPNFIDERTKQQKIQDTLADPSNKGIRFNKLKSPANITSAQISRQLDIPMGKTPEYQPSDEEIKNAINAVAQTREKLQLPGYKNLKSIDKAKILKKYKEHCEEGEHYGNKDLTAAKGFVPNFANVNLYRGQKNKTLDAPDISESLPSFASAQTPDDVVAIVQDFVKRHVSGNLSGYRNKQGVAGEKKASGANSFSTSPQVADNFANSIDLTTNDMSQGQVFKKTVPSKNIFNKAKLLKILNKGSDPKSGSYPSVEKFKKEIESGAIKNWSQRNGGMYLNISGVNNDPSSGKGYGQSMKQIVPPADVGYNKDRTRQIHQGEREVIQLFNNGLVPNFSRVERVQKSQKRRVKEQITEGDKDLAYNIFDYLKTNISNLSSRFRFNRSTVSFGGNPEDYEKVFNHSSSRKNKENLIEIARSEMKMNRILKGFMIPHTEGSALARKKHKAPRDPFLNGAMHSGHVPNFSDPLRDAVSREMAAGVPRDRIRIEKSNELKGPQNPMGLAVTNTRDEPMGVSQGIKRAKSMGIDPKKHGASSGVIPNFAEGPESRLSTAATKVTMVQTKAIKENIEAVKSSSDASSGGLMKLFMFQSLISTSNGFLEQFAQEGSGAVQTMAKVGMGLSNLGAAFIQQKMLISEVMEGFDIGKEQQHGALDLLGKGGKDARGQVGKGIGAAFGGGGFLKGLATAGKGLLRFAPIVGQLHMAFTAVNEAFKMFNIGELFGLEKGSGVMDLLSTQGERAAKKLEKLGESTDKLQSALEGLKTQSENNEKIEELEILGSKRTQKEELKLQQLKVKGFELEIKSQDAMSLLLDENMVGSKVAERFTEELAKGTAGNEDYSKIIQEVISAQRKQASFLQGTESFGKLIDKKLDTFNDKDGGKFLKSAAKMRGAQLGMGLSSVLSGGEDAETEDRLRILNKNIEALSKETNVDLTGFNDLDNLTKRLSSGLKGTESFDSEMIASQIGMFGNNIDEAIDNMKGLDKLESEAFGEGMEKIVLQLKTLRKKLKGESDRKVEAQLKKEYVEAYKQVIFETGELRKNTKHQSKLSFDALKHANSMLLSGEKLSLEYNAIGKETAISLEFARKRNEIDSKFTNDLQSAEIGVIDSLNKTRDTYLNTEALASMFNQKGSEADKAVGKLKDKIKEGVKNADFSAVQTELGIELDTSAMDSLSKIFQDVAAESKNFKSNIEIMTMFAKKHGEILDSNNSAALIALLNQLGIVNISEEDLIKARQILREKDRKLELLKQSVGNERTITDLNEKEKLISQKTVQGALELFRHLGMDVNIAAAIAKKRKNILESIKGEAMHMAVTNKQGEGLALAVAQSSEMQQKGLESQKEKNRNDAIAAVLSLRQLESQTGALSESTENKIILEAKNKSEILSAETAAQESQSRLEFLSSQKSRSELVKQQLGKEISDLRSGNLLAAEKNRQLSEGKALTELVGEQREQALHSARLEALIAAENAILLTEKGKQAKLIQQANELQEASNKLTEFQNAITKAKVDKRALAITAGADIGIEKANAIASTRTAGMRAQIDPSAENMAAYAASLEETNKLLGNGSRAMNRLRSKMAELNVGAENLGADLVDIGIDNARSGLKQLFKDIGSGSKSASEAWSDFGLGLADQLLDRMTDANIDKILKDLTFAFTGEDGKSDEAKMTDEMRHFGGALEKLNTPLGNLTSEVRLLREAMQNQISREAVVNKPPLDFIPPPVEPKDLLKKIAAAAQKAKAAEEAAVEEAILKASVASFDNLTKGMPDLPGHPLGEGVDYTGFAHNEAPFSPPTTPPTKASPIDNKLLDIRLKENKETIEQLKGEKKLLGEAFAPGKEPEFYSYTDTRFEKDSGSFHKKQTRKEQLESTIPKQKNEVASLEERRDSYSSIAPEKFNKKTYNSFNKNIEKGKGLLRQNQKELERITEEINRHKRDQKEVNSSLKRALDLQKELTAEQEKQNTKKNLATLNQQTPTTQVTATANQFSGGKIQHFAKGGFVDGPAGVDKVPAMLTAGEYVVPKEQAKQFKHSGGEIQNFSIGGMAKELNNPNTESRPIRGAQGVTQLLVMNEVARGVAKYLEKPKDDGPPTFDKNKFNNLDLRSDVNIKRGDPRLSARFLAKDPVMQEYKDYLLEKAAYDAEKKNQKVDKKMQTIGSIVSFMSTFAIAEMTSAMTPYVEKAIGWAKDKATNTALGHTGFGEHSDAFKQARKQNIDMDYSDLKGAESTGYLISNDNKAYAMSRKGTWNLDPSKTLSHRRALQESIKKQSTKRQSGGSVPAMLTAGEGFVPAAIAKRIGYDNLNSMNTTGGLPIVQGKGGIDNVGPVGLTEGDFIIKKSSTDKLLRENPNMMRFALQNPEGFKRGERGYYEGGVVGDAPAVPTSSVPRAAPTNRIKNSNPVEMFNQSFNQKSEPAVAAQQKSETTNNINVNVTIDQTGKESVSTDGSASSYEEEQQLSLKIKSAVMDVIREEKRIGGELSS